MGGAAWHTCAMTVIERYLSRIGAGFPLGHTDPVEVLDDLLARHAAAIPFENLDPLTGQGVSLLPADVAGKLIDAHRGGFCHEHALLSQQVLTELGYECFGILARVYRDPALSTPSGQTHHATLVRVDGELRLFDPGFGGGTPTMTLPVHADARVGEFRLVRADEVLDRHLQAPDVELLLQRRAGSGVWINLYGFADTPALPADIEVSNWFVATSPAVMFTRLPVLSRPMLDGTRHMFRGRSLRTVGPAGETAEEVTSRERFGAVVREIFGIDAPPELLDDAWARSAD